MFTTPYIMLFGQERPVDVLECDAIFPGREQHSQTAQQVIHLAFAGILLMHQHTQPADFYRKDGPIVMRAMHWPGRISWERAKANFGSND